MLVFKLDSRKGIEFLYAQGGKDVIFCFLLGLHLFKDTQHGAQKALQHISRVHD